MQHKGVQTWVRLVYASSAHPEQKFHRRSPNCNARARGPKAVHTTRHCNAIVQTANVPILLIVVNQRTKTKRREHHRLLKDPILKCPITHLSGPKLRRCRWYPLSHAGATPVINSLNIEQCSDFQSATCILLFHNCRPPIGNCNHITYQYHCK